MELHIHVHLVSELMLGHRRIIFGNGTEPAIFVPKLLSNMTKTLIGERAWERGWIARPYLYFLPLALTLAGGCKQAK